jgi:hypothetical protein
MELRFYIDPESGEPHIYKHQVSEREAEDVLRRPIEDRAGRDGSRVATGQTRAGRYLRVIYVPDPEPESLFVITALDLGPKALRALKRRRKKAMSKSKLPKNWDDARVKGVLKHYESQSDEEATAEDEAAYNTTTSTSMDVPVDLVPKVRELIAKRKAS